MSEYAGWGTGDIHEMHMAIDANYPQEDDKDVLRYAADMMKAGEEYDPYNADNFAEAINEFVFSPAMRQMLRSGGDAFSQEKLLSDSAFCQTLRNHVEGYWRKVAIDDAIVMAADMREQFRSGHDDY